MRGHEPIIAMRSRGQRPSLVLVNTVRDLSRLKAWQDWPEVHPALPSVWIQPEDAPSRLDLRFLVGLTVVVTGCDAQRVQAIEAAATEAGAARVLTGVRLPGGELAAVSDTGAQLGADALSPEAARAAELLAQHIALLQEPARG